MLVSSSEDKSQEIPKSGSADAALKKELLSYRNKKRVNINENLLKWWRVPREELKELSPIARRFLSPPPAIVPSERCSVAGPKNKQGTFLISLIKVKPTEQKRKRKYDSTVSKENSFKYFVMQNNSRIPVCKKAFMSLHALAQTTIQRLKGILVSRECPRDKKGKHKTRPRVLLRETIIKIQKHIASFPTKTTHYEDRSDSESNVFDDDLLPASDSDWDFIPPALLVLMKL
ncbi:hypothetical protein ILUMI_24419 [Ignelater luminosus]|uniref:HAT C-terminal dimerisation domain-containing protein n=1 Tax=Ignelater luminosus TaxID=2038154 RepID=A0A8K0CAJ0_IGNLU|nr:hypothetical protein ILUMI_24419 [Ignelater luminosus]